MNPISAALQQAQALLAQENYAKVIEITTEILESRFSNANKETLKLGTQQENERLFALQLRCGAYFGCKEYADTLADADQLIRLLPRNAIGYYYRGAALLHFDEIEDAKADFNFLLSLSLPAPMQASVHHSLGLSEYILGHYEVALRHYEQALHLAASKDTTAPIYGNIGIVYFRQHDMANAWDAYKTAYEIDPDYDYGLMGLAVLHAAEGQWDEALKIWRSLAAKHEFFKDLEEVVDRYYHWTPPMADLVRQIAARAAL